MKKNEKRIVSILLTIALVFTMSGVSFATTTGSATTSKTTSTTKATTTKPATTTTTKPTTTTAKPATTTTTKPPATTTTTKPPATTTTTKPTTTTTKPAVTSAPAVTIGGFTDIKGHWAQDIIKEASDLHLVGGYPNATFRPDQLIKREEFYKLLTNVLTVKPDVSNTQIKFKDVVANEWYVPTIKLAVAGNLTQGYEDGTFGIGRLMSRQEAAKVAACVIPTHNIPSGAQGASIVKDKAQIGEWAYEYVDTMFKKGYMKGDTEGNFRPTMPLTRAEATVILLNLKKNEPVIASNANELTMTGCLKSHKAETGAFTKGDGTKADPYQISNEAQLNHLRMHTSEAAFYVLTQDVRVTKDFATGVPKAGSDEPNWSDGNFVPIGTKENPFKGYLDGDGYSISGLNITGLAGGTLGSDQKERGLTSNVALFGYVGNGASIDSLSIDQSTIKGGHYTGGIVAYNQGTIKNCTLKRNATVTGGNYTGGIIGYSEKPVVNNNNEGTVVGTATNTGGVVGYVHAAGNAVDNCENRGNVNGNERTGGVVGAVSFVLDETPTIKDCSNTGTVNGGMSQAGGVVGLLDGSSGKITIEECYNKGIITGVGVLGGVVGQVKSNKVTITECYNEGTVTGGSTGGVVGSNEGILQYCYNKGNVLGNNEAGGLVAFQNEKAIITKCYNEGSITSNNYAGGLVGTNESKINNSYNAGIIKGVNGIGGIAGKNQGTIENVYGAGLVSASNGAGSLIGRNAGVLKNSFWLEDTASSDVGMSDGGNSPQVIKRVTKEELSGQKKIKTANGYEMVIDIMNRNNATTNEPNPKDVWKYKYHMTSQASKGTSTVVSDGGGIVKPLVQYSTDEKGNTIDPSDLGSVYLYPCIVNL